MQVISTLLVSTAPSTNMQSSASHEQCELSLF